MTAGDRRRSVGILTHTAIADDPRVRRQVEAFSKAGWRVLAFGAKGGRAAPPAGELLEAHLPSYDRTFRSRLRRLVRLGRLQVQPWAPEAVFWNLPENYGAILELAEPYRPDLWLANDWTMLPLATRLAERDRTPFIYDTHEFASDEFPENWKWRTFMRPLVSKIEAAGIARAAEITCVSDGIADRLAAVYGLARRPVVVRNVPRYEEVPFRPCGERIKVLYHGLVMPNRGLEALIGSVALWRSEFELTIRGPVSDTYLAELRRLAGAGGVAQRVHFDPPVPFTDLVRAASTFDIGIFVLSPHSHQNRYVLPNKLFEYTMAGLCVCVSDLPEMAAVIAHYGQGRLIAGLSATDIATVVNGLDRSAVEEHKRRALAAARELSWEHEERRMMEIADALTA